MADTATKREPQPPTHWKQYIWAIGPGFFIAMAWLGTGDLIDNSVSGANYGYALMWALVLALVTKFFFVSALSKYQLGNAVGDETVMQGFARVWRPLSRILAICIGCLIFVYESYFVPGAGTALFHLFGEVGGRYGIFLWSALVVAVSILILVSGREYKIMEVFARVTVALLVLTFVIAAAIQRPDFGALLEGLVFQTPPDRGVIGSTILAVSIMGIVGVTPATIIYPYAIQEKGWKGLGFRRLQLVDAFVGIAAIAIIDLAVWTTSAETMRGRGATIDAPDDLSAMMERAIGPIGPTLLWLALFFVTFSSIASTAYIYTRMVADGFTASRKGGRDARKAGRTEGRIMRYLPIAALIVPLVFTLPWAPNLITLTVLGGAISVLAVPAFLFGIIYITTSRRLMLPGAANKWWEIVILLIISVIAVWAIYGLLVNIGGTIAGLFG